ncbi:hypothetical protein JOD14_001741 [Enterococcus lemanii]|nr:hypothetical protein [Enterococcus lemanii]
MIEKNEKVLLDKRNEQNNKPMTEKFNSRRDFEGNNQFFSFK